MERFRALLDSVRELLGVEDLRIDFRKEEEFGFKKSEGPSSVARIFEVRAPDGRIFRISLVETHYDDAGVSYQETFIDLWQNWMEPSRIYASMSTGEGGVPVFSDEELFWSLNALWGLVEKRR